MKRKHYSITTHNHKVHFQYVLTNHVIDEKYLKIFFFKANICSFSIKHNIDYDLNHFLFLAAVFRSYLS